MLKKIYKGIMLISFVILIAFTFGKIYVLAATDPKLGNSFGSYNPSIPDKKTTGTIKTTSNSEATDGFGIYIKLVKYNSSTKKEDTVGTPVLLYSGNLFSDITNVNSAAKNATISGGNAIVGQEYYRGGSNPPAGHPNAIRLVGDQAFPTGVPVTPTVDRATGSVIYKVGTNLQNINGKWVDTGGVCHKSSNSVFGAEKVSYYKRVDIRFLYDGTIYDKNGKLLLTEKTIKGLPTYDKYKNKIYKSAVDLSKLSNIYTYADTYLFGSNSNVYNSDSKIFRTNGGRGIVTLTMIRNAFNATISASELDSYYISIEPVIRQKTDVVVSSWTTTQSSTSSGGSALLNCKCSVDESKTKTAAVCSGSCTHSYDCSYSKYEADACGGKGCVVNKSKTCSEEGSYISTGTCASYSYTSTSTLITNHLQKISVIQVARDYKTTTNNSVNNKIKSIANLTSSNCMQNNQYNDCHCVLDGSNVCHNVYEHFIGPTLAKAIVGTTSNNKYKFGDGINSPNPKIAETNAVGVGYWWMPQLIDCKKECGAGGNTDDFLKCAENFCDNQIGNDTRANVVKLKRNCILNACGYWYGMDPKTGDTSPENPDKQSKNSCANANPYQNRSVNLNKERLGADATSLCSMSNDKKLEDIKGVYVTCDGDTITDFDKKENESPPSFDMRTYINVACKESSAFKFTDVSQHVYVAGEGIDYNAKLIGEKECTIFFNLEQWKFDYATIHSEDKVRQNRLKHIYTVYNNLLKDGYNHKNSGYWTQVLNEDTGKMEDAFDENDGKISLSDYEYDYNKVGVSSKVLETIRNEREKENEKDSEILENIKVETTTNQNIIKNETVTMIKRNSSTTANVNKYLQVSKVNSYYAFQKRCISNDGKATPYLSTAPDDVCYTSEINYTPVKFYAQNKYYTNIAATPNKRFANPELRHDITSTVAVPVTSATGASNYYENKETCEYKIDDNGASCQIIIEVQQGTEPLGYDIYEGQDGSPVKVVAYLNYKDNLDSTDEIQDIKMKVRGEEVELADYRKEITIVRETTQAVEDVEIEGIITSKKGVTYTCDKTIHLLKHTTCGQKCTINKVNDTLYEVESIGSKKNETKGWFYSLSTDMTRRKITKSVIDSKYYVRLTRPLGTVEKGFNTDTRILFGYVQNMPNLTDETKTGFCRDYCRTDNDLPNCVKEYKPAEIGKIAEYCSKHYQEDVNNYESQTDCVNRCTAKACPNDTRNLDIVNTYCDDFENLGYNSKELCINRCYYCPECSKTYVYRPVNVYNPFPYSSVSNELLGYQKGDRIIGSNWYGLSHYITDDDNDQTTVTGPQANQSVEYEINLDMAMIERIRNDTASKASDNFDPYTDYEYAEGSGYGYNEIGPYKSKFIREDFSEIFVVRPTGD